jgi:hypothetical protein
VDYPILNPTHYLLAKLAVHYFWERGLMRVLPQSNKLASKSGFREQFALMSGNTDGRALAMSSLLQLLTWPIPPRIRDGERLASRRS